MSTFTHSQMSDMFTYMELWDEEDSTGIATSINEVGQAVQYGAISPEEFVQLTEEGIVFVMFIINAKWDYLAEVTKDNHHFTDVEVVKTPAPDGLPGEIIDVKF